MPATRLLGPRHEVLFLLASQVPSGNVAYHHNPRFINPTKEAHMGFILGCLVGGATVYFWSAIKTKVLAWYDALVAKI